MADVLDVPDDVAAAVATFVGGPKRLPIRYSMA